MINNTRLSRHPVYLDHHATTPVAGRVLAAMLPFFHQDFGNAASVDHDYGARAHQAVATARQQIADLIHADPDEIIFTSGATEANNLALSGVMTQYADRGNHIITCGTEHAAILDTCHYLEQTGCRVTYVPVDSYGLVDPAEVEKAICSGTILISIMMANNEIGTIAPIVDIGKIAREHQVLFHTDAAQAVGHIPIDVNAMAIDLLSMSGHKIYGPKGIGALFVRRFQPRVRLSAQMHGGGHERGLRSGTLNVPGIVGFGTALALARNEMAEQSRRLQKLRDRLWNGLKVRIPDLELNGHSIQRLPHNLNIAIPGIESKSLVLLLKHDLALATGAACTTTRFQPSHVILAMGYSPDRAFSSVRFGLGWENTEADVDFAIDKVVTAVIRLRQLR